MTRIKVCGITNLDDARSAIECGADAIGFVFASSKRRRTPEQVRNIVQQVTPFVVTVGVFMDETVEQVRRIACYTGIDVVQLHGSEPSSYCAQLGKRVIKRIPIANNATTGSLLTTMDPYEVSAFLLDPGTGSGQTFDWSIVHGIDVPVIVAGGLDPGNVGQVVRMLHPYGVDVCSGVEKVPGIKDKIRIRNFIEEVRRCS
jgi:phosphoribosylanthranilate isomerase